MILRFILSIYFYENEKKNDRFFDVWWQFTYTIEYAIVSLLIALTNIYSGLTGVKFNPLYYLSSVLILFILNLFLAKIIKRKYEELVISELSKIDPYPLRVLYVIAFFGILLLMLSFKFLET